MHEFNTGGVGAGLVPARAKVVQAERTGPTPAMHEFNTGRDKPVPYGSAGVTHEFDTGQYAYWSTRACACDTPLPRVRSGRSHSVTAGPT